VIKKPLWDPLWDFEIEFPRDLKKIKNQSHMLPFFFKFLRRFELQTERKLQVSSNFDIVRDSIVF
jgi:hypothetical protein